MSSPRVALSVALIVVVCWLSGASARPDPPALSQDDLATLQAQLPNARVYGPWSNGWAAVADPASGNQVYNGTMPAAVVVCSSAADVQGALQFALNNQQDVSVRAGGLSPGGFYVRDSSFLIDIGMLGGVTVDGASMTAVVGGAARVSDVAASLDVHGLVFPLPGEGSLTIGAYLLAGGLGVGAPMLGLAADWILSMSVVTPDGSAVQTVTAGSDPDLWYALRGGGGGNFGVVVSFTLQLRPAPSPGVIFGTLTFLAGDLGQPAAEYFAATSPGTAVPEADFALTYSASALTVSGVWMNRNQTAMDAYLSSLLPLAASAQFSYGSYRDALAFVGGGWSTAQPYASQVVSRFLPSALAGAEVSALAALVDQGAGPLPSAYCSWSVRPLGGAVAANQTDSPFPGRSSLLLLSAWVSCSSPQECSLDQANAQSAVVWLTSALQAVQNKAALGYIGLPDPIANDSSECGGLYYGAAAFQRLIAIKAKVDPSANLWYQCSVPLCVGCDAGDIPSTGESADSTSLIVIIVLAVLCTAYLAYVIYRRAPEGNTDSSQPLLSGRQ